QKTSNLKSARREVVTARAVWNMATRTITLDSIGNGAHLAPNEVKICILIGICAGIVRAKLALFSYLNPDEAMHYFLSHQPSLRSAYAASLNSAHPPLMILVLYLVQKIGNGEFLLRLPSVIAGTLLSEVGSLWTRHVFGRQAGLLSLVFFAFTPS